MRDLMIALGVVAVACGFCMLLLAGAFSTRYAPTYSERGFKRVRVGMGTNEVLKLAGKPLFDPPATSEYWLYTTCNNNFWTYKRRWLRMQNGIVVEILSGVAED